MFDRPVDDMHDLLTVHLVLWCTEAHFDKFRNFKIMSGQSPKHVFIP